jgi:hypothetical protein
MALFNCVPFDPDARALKLAHQEMGTPVFPLSLDAGLG